MSVTYRCPCQFGGGPRCICHGTGYLPSPSVSALLSQQAATVDLEPAQGDLFKPPRE